MRALLLPLLALAVAGCAAHPKTGQHVFEIAPSFIDHQDDPAIEDYIVALPPYSFHEGPVENFAALVRHARALPQNAGKSLDCLYVPGDGTWPSKEFFLERAARRLRIRVHAGPEPDAKAYTTTMRRVNGGWVRNG